MEQRTAQVRVRKNIIIAEGCEGSIFWTTPTRAQVLIDAQAVTLLNAPAKPGPAETKPAAAAKTKDALEKKSSAAAPAGRSTASASSSAPGTAALSSASAAAPASAPRRSPRRSKAAPS